MGSIFELQTELFDRIAKLANLIRLCILPEHREVAKALLDWTGKTAIDAMNAYPVLPEKLDGLPSSAFAAKSFAGARFVKGFNQLIAATMVTDPVVAGGHLAVFLSSDDDNAIATAAALAKQLGFAPAGYF